MTDAEQERNERWATLFGYGKTEQQGITFWARDEEAWDNRLPDFASSPEHLWAATCELWDAGYKSAQTLARAGYQWFRGNETIVDEHPGICTLLALEALRAAKKEAAQ